MRFKSGMTSGYQVFAVSGTNTVSFGIAFDEADIKGLLGFAVERIDPVARQTYFMFGYKVFESVIPHPDSTTTVKTYDQPIQSFVWDDFTANPGQPYTYIFHPLKGTPKNLDRSAKPIKIDIRTEPLYSDQQHDIFFNRGVASSQAYSRRFGNKRPDKLPPAKQQEAWDWLSRKLKEAMLKFIGSATKNDTLLCCFYEFRYPDAANALKAAIDRGVDVRLIVDAKVNEHTDKKGFHPSFPREDNLKTLKDAGIPKANTILREAKPNDIAHNKFMILLKGKKALPSEVWTGSTNLSESGIFGQTNVGHWVRNADVASSFKAYWDFLSSDPGPQAGENAASVKKKNIALRDGISALETVPTAIDAIPAGITTVFSPRSGSEVLNMYASMVDNAEKLSCITLAFGIGKVFKTLLSDNTPESHIAFFLLEKQDKPNPRSKTEFVGIDAKNNVYKAWGSYLRDPLYQWTRETNARSLQISDHVSYVHSKFLLMDPLSDDPIVVTGSANFSDASTNDNDENMLLIRGDRRVADIYFTEFNRLFFHYYFRSVQETTAATLLTAAKRKADKGSLFLDEDDRWIQRYKPGSLKRKRVAIFSGMSGFTQTD